ncbi:aminotransferase class I/II-fold pyridoxal phosphate-dependent enzyme (plasmid) [Bradyrhizobium barranii]|uniref:Aminotransferase class I/II-fold pyridoxal phosphate-dependent enzyme n=1 Tax=Bradyrhizobium barranii TaxID=2992140 RepID=A0ABY3R2D5_9BRAD|nr:aminotransferase class I/II-fold pyridoxal phosphate-dependent enzyme [Bradyrhizobium japonicum]UFW92051.1 aminotransferase class I/II-fold pyridoxal phosphate-dependent enzyme [Bradyrhizobium japonicum]
MTASKREAGDEPEHGFSTRAVSHPVYTTSTYVFGSVAELDAAAALGGKLYAREFNPTTALLESRLASLEGAENAVVLASGMAAFGALVLSLLSQDDEIIVHRTLYSNTTTMTEQGLPRFGIKTVAVDLSDPTNLDGVFTSRTKAVYFETPINPTGDVLDIAAIASRAHQAGLLVFVDRTFASPALQRPLQCGADIVLHSLTKYVSGHGDLLGGALLGRMELIEKIRDRGLRYITGAVLSPMASSLILRGIKTLPLRMERHGSNALAIARMLDGHAAVKWVNYPFLPSHPRHAIAKRQMSGGSGMLSFGLRGGFEAARQFLDNLKLITLAVSLGDAETLVMHPASLALQLLF